MIKKIGFLLSSMSHLKYYIPLVIESKKQNITPIIFFIKGSRTSMTKDKRCPIKSIKNLILYSKKYNFIIDDGTNLKNIRIIFDIDGLNKNFYLKIHKIISITWLCDYIKSYPRYINQVNYCIFNGKKFTNEIFKQNKINKTIFLKNNHKNLFLGSPKYDMNLNKNDILSKYKLSNDQKYIFFFLPKLNMVKSEHLLYILNYFYNKNYFLILKTRNKDQYAEELKNRFPKNNIYVNDTEWFPHPSLELIYISDFVFNFDSSGSIEAIMLNKYVIHYKCKSEKYLAPFVNKFIDDMWNEFISIDNINQLEYAYNNLMTFINDISKLKTFKKNYFIEDNEINSSEKIINFLINNM